MKRNPDRPSRRNPVLRSSATLMWTMIVCCPIALAQEIPAPAVSEAHMPETIRADVGKLIVIGGYAPTGESVTGSYDKETAGLFGGMEEGSRIGTISREIGGVPVNIPIPVIGTLGSIYGGISGAAKREIQEFRDALTEELVSADSPPLRSDGLALDAFWAIRRIPSVDSHLFAPTAALPPDAETILYINLNELVIDVQGDDAIITASAAASLHHVGDNRTLYATTVHYQDRDRLKQWTANENALWREYVNFARFYLARELAADLFDAVLLDHELRPVETDSVRLARKSGHRFHSESLTPTLAWALDITGGSYGPWVEQIDESGITYDIEIFDSRQLVYQEKEIPDPAHTVGWDLEPCKIYRWSVRPIYEVNGDVRFGEWMRPAPVEDAEEKAGKGIFGREASAAPAYTQDFATLETACKR